MTGTRRPTLRRTPGHRLRRGVAAAAVAPLLLVGAAACGSDDGSDAGSGTHSGGSKGSDTRAGATVLTGLEKGDDVDGRKFVDLVAEGMKKSTTAHVTMTMEGDGSGGLSAEGDVDYTGKAPAMSMTMSSPGGPGEQKLVLVDGVMYVEASELGAGKYYKIDPSDPDSPLAAFGLDKTLKQADPAGALENIRPAISKAEYVGEEDVDGRDLDHYELTVDLRKAVSGLGGDLPSAAASMMPTSVTYGVWLDDEDRFAQMTMVLPMRQQEYTMTMTADDWGKDVSIKAPPADQVEDFDLGAMMPGAPTGA